ncbi:MAG TPA: hypothetical protein VGL71_06110 [Urbifossiella sp.]
MRREDCVELFKRIPEHYHAQVNLILRGQGMITVDIVVRFEPTYMVLRGREQGSTDEGRAFFVPYEELAYFRIERVLKLSELKKMYGETGVVDMEDQLGQDLEKEAAAKANPDGASGIDSQTPAPMAPQDPAAIAKQNLLERIRAARAGATSTTGKLTK